MDHEVVPCFSKICDWLLNLSQDHFDVHQAKNVRVIMELEVPKMLIFRPTLSIFMVQQFFAVGEAKEVLSLQMLGDHVREMSLFFGCQRFL
jgi:hypothetical protein